MPGSVCRKPFNQEKNTVFQNNLHFKVSCKMKEDPVLAGGVVCNGKATSLLTTLQERRHVFEGTIHFLKNKKQPGVEISFVNIWNVISSWSRRTVTCLLLFTASV